MVELIGTAESAAQGATNLQMVFPNLPLVEHRVEGHQLVNIDRLQLQLSSNPFNSLTRDVSELFLHRVQQHERCAPFLGVMRDDFVDFGLQRLWYDEIRLFEQRIRDVFGIGDAHRSHSPMTKSKEPRMATTSLTMCPGRMCGRMLRFTNDGARILRRYGVPPPLL